MIAWLRCTLRQYHNPFRHPLGGFKCRDCGEVGRHLGDMGFDGYVSPIRRIFRRGPDEVTRSAW